MEGEPNEERRYSSDIVIETSIGRIKNCDDFNPELKIISFDIENVFPPEDWKEFGTILVIGYSISTGKSPVHETGAITGEEFESKLQL